MTVKISAISVLTALLCVGCLPPADPSDPPPGPKPEPTPDAIEQMCERLEEMGCEEGKDVYNSDVPGPIDVPNQSCADFYKELQGKGVPINAKCVLTVPSCDVIEEYRAKDPSAC